QHQLGPVGLQVGGLEGFAGKLLLEGGFQAALFLQLGLAVLDEELVAHHQGDDRQQHGGNHLHRRRPGAQVVQVQVRQIDLAQPFQGLGQAHFDTSLTSCATGTTCCTVSWKLLACSTAPEVTALTSARFGAASQAEPSRLRIRLDTLLLDSAVPRMEMREPVMVSSLKCTPSGRVRASSSNTRTMIGRLPCRSWMIFMRSSSC